MIISTYLGILIPSIPKMSAELVQDNCWNFGFH